MSTGKAGTPEQLFKQNQQELTGLWHAAYDARHDIRLPVPLRQWHQLTRILWRNVENISQGGIEQHAEKHDGARPECAAGRAHCCYQTIECSSAEIIRIVEHMREQKSPEQIAALQERAFQLAPRVGRLTKRQRYDQHIGCPALNGDRCGIYAARPVACRAYLSMSRHACEFGKNVPILAAPQLSSQMHNFGLDAAMHVAGLEMVSVELTEGLALALIDTSIVERWLAGGRVFGAIALKQPEPYPKLLDEAISRMTKGNPHGQR